MPCNLSVETLRVDLDIAIRDAGRAFVRGDRDGERLHFERASRIEEAIFEVEARAERNHVQLKPRKPK